MFPQNILKSPKLFHLYRLNKSNLYFIAQYFNNSYWSISLVEYKRITAYCFYCSKIAMPSSVTWIMVPHSTHFPSFKLCCPFPVCSLKSPVGLLAGSVCTSQNFIKTIYCAQREITVNRVELSMFYLLLVLFTIYFHCAHISAVLAAKKDML